MRKHNRTGIYSERERECEIRKEKEETSWVKSAQIRKEDKRKNNKNQASKEVLRARGKEAGKEKRDGGEKKE